MRERTALGLVLPIPLTKEDIVNRFQPQSTGKPPETAPGSCRIKHELAEKGGSERRAAFWDSFPQLPTCTQPNRGQDYKSQNSEGAPFPFTPGDWNQTLKETPKALSLLA